MSLINCPECNKEISDSVKKCPACGYKIKKHKGQKEPRILKTSKQKILFKIILIIVIIVLLGVGGFFGYTNYIVPLNAYNAAKALVNEQKFDDAIGEFEKLGDFKDSKNKVLETHYEKAEFLLKDQKYQEAITEFEAAESYKDAKELVKSTKYSWAQVADVDTAINLYTELGDYEDAKSKLVAAQEQKRESEALAKIKSAYSACTSSGTVLSSDGRSITVDSDDEYDFSSLGDILTIINKLGLPDSLFDEMCGTNALMGRQRESYDYYEVSWSYHPDNGLDAIFKYKK